MGDFKDLINQCVEKGMKQKEIAEVMGVTRTAVTGYLSGTINPAPVRVELLAKFVGVDMAPFDPAKVDCALHDYDKNGRHTCKGLKECQCAFGKECRFYKTGVIVEPDPLYDPPAPPHRKPQKRIPQEIVDQAVVLREKGLMWSEVAEIVGWDCCAIRNRVAAARRKAAGIKRKKPAS